jgi:hypothetical protein
MASQPRPCAALVYFSPPGRWVQSGRRPHPPASIHTPDTVAMYDTLPLPVFPCRRPAAKHRPQRGLSPFPSANHISHGNAFLPLTSPPLHFLSLAHWRIFHFAGIACLFPLPDPYDLASHPTESRLFPLVPMSRANGLQPLPASHDPPPPSCTPDTRHAGISLPSLPFREMSACTPLPYDPGLRRHPFSLPYSRTPGSRFQNVTISRLKMSLSGGIQIFDPPQAALSDSDDMVSYSGNPRHSVLVALLHHDIFTWRILPRQPVGHRLRRRPPPGRDRAPPHFPFDSVASDLSPLGPRQAWLLPVHRGVGARTGLRAVVRDTLVQKA